MVEARCLGVAAWAGLTLAVLGVAGCAPAASPPQAAEDVARGRVVYVESCAACHGERAEGHPDYGKTRDGEYGLYPPPPHDATGHTWHHGDGTLFRIISEGGKSYEIAGFESKMPAFRDVLSEEDIRAVVAYFKSLWGERERLFQAEVTANEKTAGDR